MPEETTGGDSPAAQELLELMQHISEDQWSARWIIGLEHTLWDWVHGNYGKGRVSAARKAYGPRLKELHEACGGWWAYPVNDRTNDDPTFHTTAAWDVLRPQTLGAF